MCAPTNINTIPSSFRTFDAARRTAIALCALIAALGLASPPAHAATYTWDASGTGAANPTDGAGAWSTTGTNWSNGSGDVAWPNNPVSGNTDVAVFGNNHGTAGTVTIGATIDINGLIFNPATGGTYTLSGGTLSFGGASPAITANSSAAISTTTLTSGGSNPLSLNVGSGQTLTLSSATWSGNGGFSKDGGGTLTITGGNTSGHDRFGVGTGGNFAMDSGTLNDTSTFFTINDNGATGVAYNQTGGTFNMTISGGNSYIGNSGGGTSAMNVSGGTFNELGNASGVYMGFYSGANSINVSGTGSVNLRSILYVAYNGGNTSSVSVGGAGVLNESSNLWVGYGGAGSVSLSGTGVINEGGQLVLGFGVSSSGTMTQTGGTFNSTSTGNNYIGYQGSGTWIQSGGTANMAGNPTLYLGGNTNAGSAGTVTLSGSGVLNVANVVVGYGGIGGTINLNGGTLTATSFSHNGGTNGNFNFNGGTLEPNSSTTSFMTGLVAADVMAGGANINTNGFNDTISQALLSGTANDGGLTKSGTGTLTLTGVSTYTGTTTVQGGALVLGGAGSISNSGGITVSGSGAKFAQISSVATPVNIFLMQGTVDGTSTISNTVTVSDLAGNTVQNGNGGTVKLTIGNLTFNGAGAITINDNGSLTTPGINITGALTTGFVNTGGLVTINAALVGGWINGATYDLVNYGSLAGTGSANFIEGTIANLTARQSATLAVSGTEITLAINGDTPKWTGLDSNNWVVGSTGSNHNWKLITQSTPTDYISGDQVVFDDSASSGTVNISAANVTPTTTTFNNNALNYTFTSGSGFGIGGSGSLTKSGTGTLTIQTADTFTGATTINGGIVNYQNATSFGANSAITVASGATAQVQGGLAGGASNLALAGAGAANATGALENVSGTNSYAGPVALSGNTTVISTDAGSLTLSGIVSGTSGLTKVGAGTLTLTNANTYSGFTTISGGTLQVGNGGTAGSLGSGNIVDNGNLVYNYNSNTSMNVPSGSAISGSGSISVMAAGGGSGSTYDDINLVGNVTLGGSQTYIESGSNAGTNIYQGIQVYNSSVLTASSITMAGDVGHFAAIGNTLGLDTSAANGPINLNISLGRPGVWYSLSNFTASSGTGTITVAGTGPASAGWYQTPVTLTGGAVNITANVNSISSVAINSSLLSTVSGAFSGSMSLTMGGTGTLVLTNTNTYTGGTVINAGTLQVGNGGSTGSISSSSGISGLTGATIAFDTTTSGTFSQSVSGGLNVTQAGTGTLKLSNATYSGNTTVSNSGTLIVSGAISGNASVSGGGTLVTIGGALGTATVSGGTLGGNSSYSGNVAIGTGLGASNSSVLYPSLDGTTGTIISIGGNLTLNSDAEYKFALNSNTGNSTEVADALSVSGTLSLNGATLAGLDAGSTVLDPSFASNYIIAAYGHLSGSFAGIQDGGLIQIGQNWFSVNYNYEGSNQIELITAIPEPGTWGSILLGFGFLIRFQRRRRS